MPGIFQCHAIKGLFSTGFGLKKITRGLAVVSMFLRCKTS